MAGAEGNSTTRGDDTPTFVEASPTSGRTSIAEERPLRIGRYTILRQLGRGGMGVVHAAYDDELDRRIALKVLTAGATEGSLGKARMQREAQALARLSHPNVVQVYEVGLADGRLHLAMEYVEGLDLTEWLAAAPRTWRQILDVCTQAGHGLAAAHAAGLVHRDFKPANTIVGADGRVRVIDFGLARADLEHPLDPAASIGGRIPLTSSSSLVENLTQVGTLLGTPAYMAPEQLHRRPADARSDLYAFCVTLWEALYGARPFAARTVDELRAAVTREPPAPQRTRGVPAAIHRVLLRGLAFAPEDRPPGLPALLAALARAADARRRTYLSFGAAATIVAATAVGYLTARAPRPAAACDAEAALVGVWDPEARAAVESAIRATGLSYAEDTWAAISPRLDAHARELGDLRRAACLAGREPVHGESLCLERRRLELAAVVGVLRRADAGAVAGALEAVAGLQPLAACSDPTTYSAADPARAVETAVVWQQLAEARALQSAEQPARGLDVALAALAAAERLGDRRLLAAALHRAALLRENAGDSVAARPLIHRAWAVAEEVGDDHLAIDVATAMIRLDGQELRDLQAAKIWSEVATAKLGPGRADDAQRIRLLLESGIARIEAGALHDGIPFVREAVALAESVREQEPRLHISALNILASGVLKRTGELREAETMATRLVELGDRHFGRGHPYVAMLIYNLGAIRYMQHDHEGALVDFRRSLALREAAYGPRHPEVAQSLNGLAAALGDLERHAEAIPLAERSLAIEEATRGHDHPELVYPLNNLATVLLAARRPDDAEPHLRRARALLDARGLGDNSLSALVDETLAALAVARGRPAEARPLLERALATIAAHQGEASPGAAFLHLSLAGLLLDDLGDRPAARDHLTRALAVLGPEHPEELAKARALAERLDLAGPPPAP